MNGIRIGAILEWLLAVTCIGAALAAGALLVEQGRTVQVIEPALAEASPVPPAPDGLPSGSVSVPLLLLDDGSELRVGDRADAVPARVASGELPGSARIAGARVTRFYSEAGRRIAIVFTSGRVDAIYLH